MKTNWLITGAGGQFGSVLLGELSRAGRSAVGLISTGGPSPRSGGYERVDLNDGASVESLLGSALPRVIVHAAAVTSVQAAYDDPAAARRTNVEATRRLADWATRTGARLVYISTDMVFDGTRPPYDESAGVCPVSEYGRTKAEAERVVLDAAAGHLAIRLPLLYGMPAVDRPTTFTGQLAALRAGRELRLFTDEIRTPIELSDAAGAVMLAAESDVTGVFHVAGPERLSRFEMIEIAARAMGIARPNLVAVTRAEAGGPEPRPGDLSLSCERFEAMFGRAPGRPMAEAMKAMANGE